MLAKDLMNKQIGVIHLYGSSFHGRCLIRVNGELYLISPEKNIPFVEVIGDVWESTSVKFVGVLQ